MGRRNRAPISGTVLRIAPVGATFGLVLWVDPTFGTSPIHGNVVGHSSGWYATKVPSSIFSARLRLWRSAHPRFRCELHATPCLSCHYERIVTICHHSPCGTRCMNLPFNSLLQSKYQLIHYTRGIHEFHIFLLAIYS